jgi:hypothetical protein
MVRWLVREEHGPSIASRIPVPPMILLSQRQTLWVFLLLEGFLPLSVIAIGVVMWWRHR